MNQLWMRETYYTGRSIFIHNGRIVNLAVPTDIVAFPGSTALTMNFVFRYKKQPHYAGFPLKTSVRYGTIATAFGATAGIFAVFFFGEVPRVRKDILMNIPVIGGYWERSIPPEDNVS
ncbi:uncharacterized protein BDCG_17872 [Blastomyces dermatitidis ER-3]|uniref:Uncharacterized protein n=1 Tax=Ajellomyces dermatitidis (strain ER-3 / ATCC MYA-2586) TaxID=559297 RepID=A0ABX2W0R5_AJEDR|nr:uncharacterized protein BDCG_17872 [Blastomyces dermatitidis ER-3]OAT02980.1 hypothetical protein BDCG_17872 [Blastomyces dermatitidis ER-3]